MNIEDNIKKAKNITSVTLVGFIKNEFPMSRGNCFGVRTEEGEEYKIINFNYEIFKS
jgi:hypothetical protein